ncbi:hypothetical protein J7I98_37350 [Streptomyces sp. ISL-98]|uniref:hypothetical protein n=1 Tax=Streptomyces sp. ISL-98 TaxID=2819192 RepID=UPI001BEC76F3|nr:hypothetical protein [Streptomyces sp. ISL-98]MBT2511383.1 hypothetical protein [Streptomyces sp. ISL-98]
MTSATREKIDAFLTDLDRECAASLLPPIEMAVPMAAEPAPAMADEALSLAAVPAIGRGFQ